MMNRKAGVEIPLPLNYLFSADYSTGMQSSVTHSFSGNPHRCQPLSPDIHCPLQSVKNK